MKLSNPIEAGCEHPAGTKCDACGRNDRPVTEVYTSAWGHTGPVCDGCAQKECECCFRTLPIGSEGLCAHCEDLYGAEDEDESEED